MHDSETLTKIAQWRERAIAGTLTVEEMREAILFLRGNRRAAAPGEQRKAAKKAVHTASDLLSIFKKA